MSHHKFALGDAAKVSISQEAGKVTAAYQYLGGGSYFQLTYVQANGCAAVKTFHEDELEHVTQ